MINKTRVIAATLMGFLTGFICYFFASSSPGVLPDSIALQLILTRALAGFAIGISVLRLGHWSIHGIVIGGLFSLPLAFSGLMAPDNPQFTQTSMFIATVVMGMIYGFLVELVASLLFKTKAKQVQPA